jgi:hypothetical protein
MTTVLEKNFKGKTLKGIKKFRKTLIKNWSNVQTYIDLKKRNQSWLNKTIENYNDWKNLPDKQKKKILKSEIEIKQKICLSFEKKYPLTTKQIEQSDPYELKYNCEDMVEWNRTARILKSLKSSLNSIK